MKSLADTIEMELRRLHVYSMQPQQRRDIAKQLAGYGITLAMVKLAWEEAKASSRDEDSARGLLVSVLRDPATVRQIADDVEERAAQATGSGTDSGMQYVCEGNPYGWHPNSVERQRALDHDRPGEWNAFRQGYNMTVEEAREYGTTDHRRHGCSRAEHVGIFDPARVKAGQELTATVQWLPIHQPPPSTTKEREVYGSESWGS